MTSVDSPLTSHTSHTHTAERAPSQLLTIALLKMHARLGQCRSPTLLASFSFHLNAVRFSSDVCRRPEPRLYLSFLFSALAHLTQQTQHTQAAHF